MSRIPGIGIDLINPLVYLHCRYTRSTLQILEVNMKSRVKKWGNSLALRIPKSFAAEAGLHADAAVELSLVEGTLVVQPITQQPLTLDQLLRDVTDENLPGEWDTGPAVGKEVW
jgi:antitoxin MazE